MTSQEPGRTSSNTDIQGDAENKRNEPSGSFDPEVAKTKKTKKDANEGDAEKRSNEPSGPIDFEVAKIRGVRRWRNEPRRTTS